jgi:hypothetical protein
LIKEKKLRAKMKSVRLEKKLKVKGESKNKGSRLERGGGKKKVLVMALELALFVRAELGRWPWEAQGFTGGEKKIKSKLNQK